MEVPSPTLSAVTPSPGSSGDRHAESSTPSSLSDSFDRRMDKPRELHKVTERRRREKMKEYVQGMAPLIPEYVERDEKMDKLSVMKLAVEHVNLLNKGLSEDEELAVGGLLSALEERSLILKAARGVFVELNCSNFEVLDVSDSVKDVLGLSEDEFRGHFLTDFLHQEDRLRVQEHLTPPNVQTLMDAERVWRGSRKKKASASDGRSKASQQDGVETSLPADVQRSFYCRLLRSDLIARPQSPEPLKSGLKLSSNLQLPASYAFCKVSGYFRAQLSDTSPHLTSLFTDTDNSQDYSSVYQGCHFVALVTGSPLVPALSNEVVSYRGNSDLDSFCARVDTSGSYTYIDKRFLRILGVDPKKMIGQSGYVLFHKDDIPGVLAFHQRTLVSHCEGICPPFRMRTAFGYWQWLQARVSVITNPLTEQIEHFVINAYHVINAPQIPVKAEPPLHEPRLLPAAPHSVKGQHNQGDKRNHESAPRNAESTSSLVKTYASASSQSMPWRQAAVIRHADAGTTGLSHQFLSRSTPDTFQRKSETVKNNVRVAHQSPLATAQLPQHSVSLPLSLATAQPPQHSVSSPLRPEAAKPLLHSVSSEVPVLQSESLPADLFTSLQQSSLSDISHGKVSPAQQLAQPPALTQQQPLFSQPSLEQSRKQQAPLMHLQVQSSPQQQPFVAPMQGEPSAAESFVAPMQKKPAAAASWPTELFSMQSSADEQLLLKTLISQSEALHPTPQQQKFNQPRAEQSSPLQSSLGHVLINVGNSLLQAMSLPQQQDQDEIEVLNNHESLVTKQARSLATVQAHSSATGQAQSEPIESLSELLHSHPSVNFQGEPLAEIGVGNKRTHLAPTEANLSLSQMLSSTLPLLSQPSSLGQTLVDTFVESSQQSANTSTNHHGVRASATPTSHHEFPASRTSEESASTHTTLGQDYSRFQSNLVSDSPAMTAGVKHALLTSKPFPDSYQVTANIDNGSLLRNSLNDFSADSFTSPQQMVTACSDIPASCSSPVNETPTGLSWPSPTSLPSADQADLAMILQLVTAGQNQQ